MNGSRWLIWRYYLFRITNSAGFYLPVAILYLQDQEYGVGFVGFSYAVFGFATLAAEIPTGYLGDLVGRRGSLAIGCVLRAVVLALYTVVDSPMAILGLHVLWATGRSFRSGTQDAWLYEILGAHFDEDQFSRVEGRGSAILLTTSAAAAIVGSVLYTVNAGYPFFANAALAVLGLPLLYTFPAVDAEVDGRDVFTLREAVGILRLQVGRSEVRWLVAYAALFHALFLVTRVYEQPALDAVGVPVTGLGLLYAGFKLVSAGAASTAGWLDDHLGTRRVFALLIPVYAVAYGSIALVPALVIPVLFVNRGLRTVTRPIRNQYLNDRLDDVGRATVLSGASMALALVGAVARLGAGVGAQALGPVGFLPWAGAVVVVAGAVLWVAVSPVRSADPTRETGPDVAVGSD